MKVLGIETSCDETGVAVVDDDEVIANLIASQVRLHERFGGVVPELASRAHVEALTPLLDEALATAGVRVRRPGRRGGDGRPGAGRCAARRVGGGQVDRARHRRAPHRGEPPRGSHPGQRLEHGPDLTPAVCLVVSGGHTMLVHMPEPHRYEVIGQTVDDAAGEAFDKIARFLGLGFPGGPAVDTLARQGDPDAIRFPRAMADSGDYDFSLSGLKTAVLRHVQGGT